MKRNRLEATTGQTPAFAGERLNNAQRQRRRAMRGQRTLEQELQQLRDAVMMLRKNLDAAIAAPQKPGEVRELAAQANIIAANFNALRDRIAGQICAAGYPLDAREHPPDTIPCAHFPENT